MSMLGLRHCEGESRSNPDSHQVSGLLRKLAMTMRRFFATAYTIGDVFTAPNCETVSIAFLSNEVMVCSGAVKYFDNSKSEAEKKIIYQLWAYYTTTIDLYSKYCGFLFGELYAE